MKVLIVGTGWTGSKVFRQFKRMEIDATLISHGDIDVTLNDQQFDWVVNCAGVTGVPNVDACENDAWNTYNGNALFPIALRNRLPEKTRFAHFSSGCIYEGNIDSVYQNPNFFGSTYSISKGISDAYLKHNSVVFRIRMPFTNKQERKNYLYKVKNYAEKGFVYNGGQNSLTNHDESIFYAVRMILDGVDNNPYNLVNKGSVDLEWIVSKMKLKREPNWITTSKFDSITKCKRSNCVIPAYSEMSDVNESLERAIYEGGF